MKKILIACDDRVLTMLYSDELGEEGYDIASTSRISSLLAEIEQEKAELVMVDCRMDRYEKSDLREALLNGTCPVPIVFCTDYPRRAEDLGGMAYLVLKNSNLSGLNGTIQKALGEEDVRPPPGSFRRPQRNPPPVQMALWFNRQRNMRWERNSESTFTKTTKSCVQGLPGAFQPSVGT